MVLLKSEIFEKTRLSQYKTQIEITRVRRNRNAEMVEKRKGITKEMPLGFDTIKEAIYNVISFSGYLVSHRQMIMEDNPWQKTRLKKNKQ